MKIAIFSAFPQELAFINKSAKAARSADNSFRISIGRHRETELIAIETGMNLTRLKLAFKHVAREYRPDIILSSGFCGALYYQAAVGELVFASRYFFYTREGAIELSQLSDRSLHFQKACWNGAVITRLRQKLELKDATFITLPERVSKTVLRASLPPKASFPVCDRETIYLANLAYNSNIPFFAIRAVTDRADEDIPEELYSVTDENGTYQLARALKLLFWRPSLIPDSMKLGKNASLAAKNLGDAVKAFAEVAGSSSMALRSYLRSPSCRSRT